MNPSPSPWRERSLLLVCVFLAFSPAAHAYLDPGSGSFALQIGIAGLLGALFSMKLSWRRICQRVTARFAVKTRAGRRPQHRAD